MKFLTLEQVTSLHVLAIEATGGTMGLRDLGRLEAALAAPSQGMYGKEAYSRLVDKAAALIRAVIAGHPFVDGNKRTGMLAGIVLLRINGQDFRAEAGEIEDFAVKVATDKLDVLSIATWLEAHLF